MELRIGLGDPGMTLMHRVGLGGLAASLHAARGNLPGEFEISRKHVVIRADSAWDFLNALYDHSFQLVDGFIYMPGAHGNELPRAEVAALLTRGLQGTMLQHYQACKLVKGAEPTVIPVGRDWLSTVVKKGEEEPEAVPDLKFFKVAEYKHQKLCKTLFGKNGNLLPAITEIATTIAPGVMNLHGTNKAKAVAQRTPLAICLHFLLAGAVTFGRKGTGILALPLVEDLVEFAENRYQWRPNAAADFYPSSIGEAALFVWRRMGVSMVEAWAFRQTVASSDQFYRTGNVVLRNVNVVAATLAMSHFHRRFFRSDVKTADGIYPSQTPVRDLVLTNIAQGKPWHYDFVTLCMSKKDFENLKWERFGLYAMMFDANATQWNEDVDQLFCGSVHQLMRNAFGRIYSECDTQEQVNAEIARQREKWRVIFVGCRTPSDFETAFADFCARNGPSVILSQNFFQMRPEITDPNKASHFRNLFLLSLASYKGEKKEGGSGSEGDIESVEDALEVVSVD